jgi:hypothetical protein
MTAADVWVSLRKIVREATLLGTEFRIVGAEVDITGSLPPEMRSVLPKDYLFQYLGAARADKEATVFLHRFGVTSVLVTNVLEAEAAIRELSGCDPIGSDIETSPPDARPAPIRINIDGSVAARQAEPSGEGLDPYHAEIATVQLYGGGSRCFVFRWTALSYLINGCWLREQHLVAHNAAFEISFLRHHSTPPRAMKGGCPVECTMQAAGLLYGTWRRSLAAASQDALGLSPPKALQASCWSAPNLSPG